MVTNENHYDGILETFQSDYSTFRVHAAPQPNREKKGKTFSQKCLTFSQTVVKSKTD